MNGHPIRPGGLQVREQRLRIEDVAARAFGPLALHQPHHLHIVKFGKACRLRIDNLQAALAGAERKRLRAQPPANGCGQVGDRARGTGVVTPIGFTESGQCQHHGATNTIAAVVAGLRSIVTIEERAQQVNVFDQRPRLAERHQQGGHGQGRAKGRPRRPAAGLGEG